MSVVPSDMPSLSPTPVQSVSAPVTPKQKSEASKFYVSRPPRPMLARDADSMYWMSRYIERSEHIARILLVNSSLLTDVGDLAPALQMRQWQSVMTIMHQQDLPAEDPSPLEQRVPYFMAFSPENPNSLFNVLTRARENARAIRENISSEMWENLNTLYWSIHADDAQHRFVDSPDDFYRMIMNGSMLFQGLTDQTLAHDQAWNFTQVAKYLERIDVTCRLLETKFSILRAAEVFLETPLRNIHWMAVLRSCCSIESYRRNNIGDMDPLRLASFLLLEKSFPRSVRYSVRLAHEAVSAIRSEVNPRTIDPAERVLGRLDAQLEYAEMAEILEGGMTAYLQKIQADVAEAAIALQKAYFLH